MHRARQLETGMRGLKHQTCRAFRLAEGMSSSNPLRNAFTDENYTLCKRTSFLNEISAAPYGIRGTSPQNVDLPSFFLVARSSSVACLCGDGVARSRYATRCRGRSVLLHTLEWPSLSRVGAASRVLAVCVWRPAVRLGIHLGCASARADRAADNMISHHNGPGRSWTAHRGVQARCDSSTDRP
jgi:hypothetical protein